MNKKRVSTVGILVALLGSFASAGEDNYAVRLGWNSGDRVLIIHSDDVGLSHGSNQATIESIEMGIVNSVSVMMPTPWVTEWREYLAANPGIDSGLHLTLTCEWRHYRWRPLTCPDQAPGLVDPDGYMWRSGGRLMENASADEVELEIRAQLAKARRMGLTVTHLDSHMGTVFCEKYVERYVKVGIEEGIPVMMPGPKEAVRRALEWADRAVVIADMVWEGGLPLVDSIHTDSYGWKTTDKTALYVDAIRNLEPGITVMIVHPTKPNPEVDAITNGRDHLYGDYNAMIDPAVREALEEEKIIMTTWRELMERRQRVSAVE